MKQWCIGALMVLTLMTVEARAKQETIAADRLSVVTTVFPAYDFTREIAGSAVSVSILLPPGAESHSFEPTPQDIIRIQNSALFICVGGESESWVERVLSSMDTSRMRIVRMMDCVQTLEEEMVEGMQAEDEEEELAYDEHVWTSPRNAIGIVEQITAALAALDTQNAAVYQQRAAAYRTELVALDTAFRDAVASGTRKTIVFGDRFPFRYLAEEYGLSYFAAFPGCSTETEASAGTVAFIIRKIREEHIPVIFHIELSNERMADMISEETGAAKRLLHACHNISKREFDQGYTYLELMNQNVINLREALR
ncbi:MAG: metal ABC transporter substrate-binding protein [Treponema sp.]|nr:metal ABC transporter substrate-binding protein [Treponema sp.]